MKMFYKIKENYVCEDKFKFENPRCNQLILTAPHLTLTVQNLLLTV